ncbi:type IV secretion system protein VirB5 [Variovorax boronicumulans]|uniref:Type IV secretion system protein VirB5 n=1 Tax=Variovorax boronicumulans TaxID=436515 RepID=A0AAW8D9N3_9BURK|nr:type IV secretion system protein [Variovorax boronicumulans]MDP9897353.1 type IV secretion system protein VirB5 [Variovorax boronicumulans]MDQ0057413.1 type IV secretion system protein VirB5 [Variovorax boronicumulans]
MNRITAAFQRALCALVFVFGLSGAHAQIPVTDVASLTQQIQQVMSWAQQYQQMIDQLQNQKEQIENQVKQIKAVTDGRGMSQLGADMKRQALPADFLQQYDRLRSQGSSGASSGARTIYAGIKTFDCAQKFPNDQASRLSCEASAMAIPQNVDVINTSIDSAKQRQQQLQSFIGRVDTADQKAASDLSNRIASEIALMQNEKMLMDMALQQQQQQLALTQQKQAEEGAKRLTRGSGGGANPFNLN